MSTLHPALRLALTLSLGVAAGFLCQALHVPLPWTVGPLLSTAVAVFFGWPLVAPAPLRNAGQWAVGTALGLYFTPQVVALLPSLLPALLLAVAWALVMGYGFYRWLWHTNRHDPALTPQTAFFASAIGGASEMANLADRHGGRVDLVAGCHSLRLMLVVLTVPLLTTWSGAHGSDVSLPVMQEVHLPGLAVLVLLTLGAVALVHLLRLPNAWMLGPLLASLAVSGAGWPLSAFPRWMLNAGQLFIGVSLGIRFGPEFLRSAPRWMAMCALGTLGMIAASAAFAALLAGLLGLAPATFVLGTSPGGIAEMCVTAKVLQLGVPAVTALHVVRYLVVLVITRPLWAWEARRLGVVVS